MSCFNCGKPDTDLELNFIIAEAALYARQSGITVGIYKSESGEWKFGIDPENTIQYISPYFGMPAE